MATKKEMSQSRKNSVADGRKAGRTDGAEFAKLFSRAEGPTSLNHFHGQFSQA